MTTRLPIAVASLLLAVGACGSASSAADTDFVPIFDGRSLDGWLGQDMSFWSIEDGAITGTISPAHAPNLNQYLVWQGGLLDDFELKLVFRLAGSAGTPNVNGGFQFRSRRLPNGDVAGYQVDNNFGQPWKVRLYDEFGRHDLALEGETTRIQPDGRRVPSKLALEAGARDFRLDDWHEYHLTAIGSHLTLRINGKLVAEVFDEDADSFEPAGILGLQLHTGPPMKAQFKDIRLKRLAPSKPLGARPALLASASLHWQPGERPDAHQPPLVPTGEVETGIPGNGPSATAGARVARLKSGWFDVRKDLNQPKLWNAPGTTLTVYARARVPDGGWTTPIFGKGHREGPLNFLLRGMDHPSTPGPDVAFAIRTERGVYETGFPVQAVDATGWHDLVGRYDGRQLQIFCDGRLLASTAAGGALLPNDEPIALGAELRDGAPVRTFTGELEDIALWTRALTDGEVQQLSAP